MHLKTATETNSKEVVRSFEKKILLHTIEEDILLITSGTFLL
jgi:hypothetical protein